MSAVLPHLEITPQRPDWLAVASIFPTVKPRAPACDAEQEHSFPYPTAAMSGVGRLDIRAILALDRPPPRRRNPDPDDLDRLAASLDDLSICCCQSGGDETDDRRPPEVVAMHKQFLVDAVPAAGEQL